MLAYLTSHMLGNLSRRNPSVRVHIQPEHRDEAVTCDNVVEGFHLRRFLVEDVVGRADRHLRGQISRSQPCWAQGISGSSSRSSSKQSGGAGSIYAAKQGQVRNSQIQNPSLWCHYEPCACACNYMIVYTGQAGTLKSQSPFDISPPWPAERFRELDARCIVFDLVRCCSVRLCQADPSV